MSKQANKTPQKHKSLLHLQTPAIASVEGLFKKLFLSPVDSVFGGVALKEGYPASKYEWPLLSLRNGVICGVLWPRHSFFLYSVLEMEPRASPVLGECSAREPHPSPTLLLCALACSVLWPAQCCQAACTLS